mmetsp:Transcript_32516/g.69243  ORF Transcript_32516/g.69243 Transcript_32516/m.69243 type:complete len:251 (-) Transcript_32516:85-837(-)
MGLVAKSHGSLLSSAAPGSDVAEDHAIGILHKSSHPQGTEPKQSGAGSAVAPPRAPRLYPMPAPLDLNFSMPELLLPPPAEWACSQSGDESEAGRAVLPKAPRLHPAAMPPGGAWLPELQLPAAAESFNSVAAESVTCRLTPHAPMVEWEDSGLVFSFEDGIGCQDTGEDDGMQGLGLLDLFVVEKAEAQFAEPTDMFWPSSPFSDSSGSQSMISTPSAGAGTSQALCRVLRALSSCSTRTPSPQLLVTC